MEITFTIKSRYDAGSKVQDRFKKDSPAWTGEVIFVRLSKTTTDFVYTVLMTDRFGNTTIGEQWETGMRRLLVESYTEKKDA